MSRKKQIGPECIHMRDDECMRNHPMVDFINSRHPHHGGMLTLDALSFGYGFAPQMDRFPSPFVSYDPSSDDDDYDDYDDDDQYTAPGHNSYCGFPRNFLDRGLPKPSKRITPEEAAKTAKELVDEEEKEKRKAEKKKLKKMRQRERRRLEKLEKENKDKGKNKLVQVDPGSEKTNPIDIDKNKINKNNKHSTVPPDLHHTISPVESSDDDSDDDEESTIEPEELDMSSCFVSNAAAIAKRKLEQKPKPEKKSAPANSNKQHGTDQKSERAAKPENQPNDKKESDNTADASDFITKSVEFAVIGNQYAASGNLHMAVKYFTDAIKQNPKEYKLFGNRSFCYEKLLQYEKALTDAEIALSMNPKWVKGLYRKGKALVGLKRYYDARLVYSEILKLDRTCKDAAEELMRVQIMQLMEMGFTKEQSSNALIISGTVEKAIENLSGLSGVSAVPLPRESEFMPVQRNPRAQAKVPLRPLPQNQPKLNTPAPATANPPPELFPVWVGDLVPSVTGEKLYEIFRFAGPVHSVRVLPDRRCAFVNFIRKEDCEKAIQKLHGRPIDGTILVVRYPDRIHTRLGVSRDASTESAAKTGKQPDECYFWRTTGCIKNERCTYRHIPENKGIDQHKGRSQL